jgi:hypothetical protein
MEGEGGEGRRIDGQVVDFVERAVPSTLIKEWNISRQEHLHELCVHSAVNDVEVEVVNLTAA